MDSADWVLLHAKIQNWQWYKNSNMVHLFIHLLVNTNRKASVFENVALERGQLVVGLHALSRDTGMSIQKIRTCLKRLKSSNEIIQKSTNRFTVITMCNFDKYQFKEKGKQQTDNKRITNEQQQKKRLRGKEVKKHIYGEFKNVLLSDDEYKKLKDKFNSTLDSKIEALSMGIESKGYKYKSHYATVLSWARKAKGDSKDDTLDFMRGVK